MISFQAFTRALSSFGLNADASLIDRPLHRAFLYSLRSTTRGHSSTACIHAHTDHLAACVYHSRYNPASSKKERKINRATERRDEWPGGVGRGPLKAGSRPSRGYFWGPGGVRRGCTWTCGTPTRGCACWKGGRSSSCITRRTSSTSSTRRGGRHSRRFVPFLRQVAFARRDWFVRSTEYTERLDLRYMRVDHPVWGTLVMRENVELYTKTKL